MLFRSENAVKGVDVVMCSSNSIDNIYFERWLEPGIHLSSIKRPEIGADVLKRCDILLIHSHDGKPMQLKAKDVVVRESVGDRGWMVANGIDFDALPTLAELIAGRGKLRTSPEQITCFVNNVGLGYQFAVAGGVVYRKAREGGGVGHELPTDWFTETVHP